MHDGVGEDAQAGVAQRSAGGHHVGDEVGHAQLHRGLHGAVEVDGLGLDAVRHQIVVHELVEGRAHTLALDVLQRMEVGIVRRGEAERGRTEAELHVLAGLGAGVQQQVMARDADVDGAAADIHGDVERPQIEQLDVVVRVLHHELTRIGTQTIPRLGQHVPSGLRQHALVGHCDSEHGVSPSRPAGLFVTGAYKRPPG